MAIWWLVKWKTLSLIAVFENEKRIDGGAGLCHGHCVEGPTSNAQRSAHFLTQSNHSAVRAQRSALIPSTNYHGIPLTCLPGHQLDREIARRVVN